ncbi:rRNA biogenesis protein rrp5 [Wickerhamiella sorbophila]|uniref:rRNA biogenesis protein rrp5 n=1 Tax=Wickerhamiella sorbophila TaxID=45607 RepID=A0A2T0FJY1_9ASCO|nr:rRNA biogenesis protein rrp5 [Wickerhamiella sorbophila]PRT55296.1 rRNA biogenesis protein rrp5 [Wickerhamiella sorbophila]
MASKRKRSSNGESDTPSLLKEDDGPAFARLDAPFPRGGGAAATPLDIKRANAEATRDVYNQMSKSSGSKSKKSKKAAALAASKSMEMAKPKIEPLLFNRIKVGTLLLGQVSEIKPFGLVISLPSNLVGFVELEEVEEIQDDPATYYKEGQWLRAVVTGLGEAPRKRIELSISPDLVNQTIGEDDFLIPSASIQATVKSLEDHGAILSLGENSKLSAFLPNKHQLEPLSAGQIVLTSLVKAKNNLLTVSTKPTAPLATIHQQAALVPGSLVEVLVSEVLSSGCVCSIFGHINISADVIHSQLHVDPPVVGDKVNARIVFSHPSDNIGESDRTLGLSLLPNIVELLKPADSSAFLSGQILDAAKVVAVDPTVGLFLDIGLERPAFAHISRLSDDRIEDLSVESSYKVGTVHKARILSYSLADDIYYLSLEPKILNQRFLRLEQVPVGEVIDDAKVERILPKGAVIISLGDGISGLASEFHLSDIKLSQPERKFKPGQKVTVRVLAVDKAHHRIKLTVKKSLINSETPILSDLADIKIGDTSTGTLIAFRDNGAIVEFGGDVKGFLPLGEMSEATISNPKEHFRLGQSLTVRILDVDSSRSRLVLSCRKFTGGNTSTSTPGEVLSGIVSEKTKDSIVLELVTGEKAILAFTQLVDDSTKVKSESKRIKVGSKLDVVILSQSSKGTVVSLKPSLVEAATAGSLAMSLDDLEVGKKYAGFVSGINEEVGIFVTFANKLVGLVPKIEVQQQVLSVGQSVSPRVLKIDRDNNRFLLTFKETHSIGEEAVNVAPGTVVTAVIKAIKETQLNVQVGNRQGRIDVSQLFDDISEIDDVRNPLSQFSKDQTITAKIVGSHDARTHMFLPISHRTGSHVVLELSAKSSIVNGTTKPITVEALNRGDTCLVFINNITEDAVWANVTPSIRTKISMLDLTSDEDSLNNISNSFSVGQALECKVVSNTPQLVLTCLDNQESSLVLVHRVTPTRLFVRLSGFRNGIVSATESGDTFKPLETFKEGTILKSKKIVTDDDGKIWVSLRDTPSLEDSSEVNEGDLLQGYIKNISDGGVFIELARNVVGRVQISQLSDSYLKDWKKHFKIGQIVKGKVISKKNGRIELSLKDSTVSGKAISQPGLDSLEVGSVTDGTVRKVQEYGVFITIGQTGLSGLCHRSEVADRPIADLKAIFSEGDKVKVKVLNVDLDKRKVSLGMKASYFDDEDEVDAQMADTGDSADEDMADVRDIDDDSDEINLGSDDDSDEESGDDDASDEETEEPGLSVGFDWSGDILNQQAQSEDESESSDDDAPRRKRKKVEFVEDQTAKLNSRLPQNSKDFERLLVSEPNSSVLWMNYMAFQLQLSEIDTARQIARRALKTIAQREEDEKFNIWIALLNLENSFGTPETVQDVFREACQYMDSRLIHLRMAAIYAASEDKLEDAKRVYNAACKRFGSEDVQVWAEYLRFLFANRIAEEARSVLDRALRQLPRREHKDISLQVAKHEFQEGDAERGRTLFEGLVTSYPKKIDLWSVYIDQETKHDPTSRKLIENLYERVFERKLSMKQAKFFFKKWLSFEVEHGDQRGADYVKAKAAKFVQQENI